MAAPTNNKKKHAPRAALHHNTTPVASEELPFNPANSVLEPADLDRILTSHGLPPAAPGDVGTFRRAFVHSSYALRKNDTFEEGNARIPPGCVPLQEASYERLEYLGDAVLGCVTAEYLYARFPAENEGFLSRMRTGIVNGVALADLAAHMGLERHVVISKQLEETGGRENPKVLEDVLEALIGAVFSSGGSGASKGYPAARTFIVSILETYIDWAELVAQKPHVKERLHRSVPGGIKYLEVDVRGGVHTVAATSCADGRSLGVGKGPSRRLAEKAAAQAALNAL